MAPGMIGGRFGGSLLLLGSIDRRRNEFAGDDFRLVALFLVTGMSELAALILDGQVLLSVFKHQNLGSAKGMRAARDLELVN